MKVYLATPGGTAAALAGGNESCPQTKSKNQWFSFFQAPWECLDSVGVVGVFDEVVWTQISRHRGVISEAHADLCMWPGQPTTELPE